MSATARISGISLGLLLLLLAFVAAGTGSDIGHPDNNGTRNEAGLIWDSSPSSSTA